MRPIRRRAGRPTRGFSLIEVLVTLIIVSIGLLGFAALLARSIADNRQAMARSQATLLAYDVVERMRANRPAALGGAYSISLSSSPTGGTLPGDDLIEWKSYLASYLPAGNGAVAVDGSGNVSVTIEWDDNGDGVVTRFVSQSSI